MPVQRFKTKPVMIQAIQLTMSNRGEVAQWIGEGDVLNKSWDTRNLYINTGHGEAIVEVGTWVIKDSLGKSYPCADSEFQRKYELDQPRYVPEPDEAQGETTEFHGEALPNPNLQPPDFQPKKPRSV